MADGVTTLTVQNFDQEIAAAEQPVLVLFCAEWSTPCNRMAPILQEIAEEHGRSLRIGEVNVDDSPDLARRHNVTSLPVLIVFSQGVEAKRFLGAKGKGQLLGDLSEFLSSNEADTERELMGNDREAKPDANEVKKATEPNKTVGVDSAPGSEPTPDQAATTSAPGSGFYSWFDDWRSIEVSCSCGWSGTLDDAYHEPLLDFGRMRIECGLCDRTLGGVWLPARPDIEANWDKLSKRERDAYQSQKDFQAKFAAEELTMSSTLPDLEGDDLVIQWDFLELGGDNLTVLHCGGTVVWVEPAQWEGGDRFRRVRELLEYHYSERFVGLAPTYASQMYLWGDDLRAPDRVGKSFRVVELEKAAEAAAFAEYVVEAERIRRGPRPPKRLRLEENWGDRLYRNGQNGTTEKWTVLGPDSIIQDGGFSVDFEVESGVDEARVFVAAKDALRDHSPWNMELLIEPDFYDNRRPWYRWSEGWRSTKKTCKNCGWVGPLGGAAHAVKVDINFNPRTGPPQDEAPSLRLNCPACARNFGYLAIETDEDWRAAHDEYLPCPTLSDLKGDEFVIEWDFEDHEGDPQIVLRNGGAVLWSERAIWGDLERFEYVYKTLHNQYGHRFVDLVPSTASLPWLYGDVEDAPSIISRIRTKPPENLDETLRQMALEVLNGMKMEDSNSVPLLEDGGGVWQRICDRYLEAFKASRSAAEALSQTRAREALIPSVQLFLENRPAPEERPAVDDDYDGGDWLYETYEDVFGPLS